jgi:hypothetical protein
VSGGYVYVVAFSDGTVKVGRSADATRRLKDHKATARSFGLEITSEWVSPQHRDWKENELELMRLARELGGRQNNGEYFAGVDFGELAAAAAELIFVPAEPEPEAKPSRTPGKGDAAPQWLRNQATTFADSILYGEGTEDAAVEYMAEQALTFDQDLVRLLVERHMRKTLRAAIQEEEKRHPKPVPSPDPEPPEPEPPFPGAAERPSLRVIAGDGVAELLARHAA